MKTVVFTVTNDISYDQRMIRICTSLAQNGYDVLLVGRLMKGSGPIPKTSFRHARLRCLFHTGFLFYAEFNIRLFLFLLTRKAQIICSIDLDTIIPCYLVSIIKRIPRVYDAHELFCEMKEIVSRPFIYKCWKLIERVFVPRFKYGYTVNSPIAAEFVKMYGLHFDVIRNMPVLSPLILPQKTERYILYQGSVNEGRCFETLIPAMKAIDAQLIVCGDGNFMDQAKQLVAQHGVEKKVTFKGRILPEPLKHITEHAWIGVNLIENKGLNNYYSLANRFFDYMHAGVPQVCVSYPAYREIINDYPFALLIDDVSPSTISSALNKLLYDDQLYRQLQQACVKAREIFNWNEEQKKLVEFYNTLS